ncbi:hypothetical protein ACMH1V_004109, partial [Escherichia coli]
KSLATSDVAGILNAPALNPLRRVFVFIFNAFEVLDGAGIESKILRGAELPLSNTVPPEKTDGTQRKILQF